MPTDIVERLRNRNAPYGWPELADKAANEIEQLRALLKNIDYLRIKYDYVARGHLSHVNWLEEREKGLNLYVEPTAAWLRNEANDRHR